MELDDSNIEIFRQDVNYFAKLNQLISETKDAMKPLQDRLKTLNNEKKELEKTLCSTMEKNDLKKAELSDNKGTIEYQVKTAVVPIKQAALKDKMVSFFETGPGSRLSFNSVKPEDKGTEMYNFIYAKENRETVVKECIKAKNVA